MSTRGAKLGYLHHHLRRQPSPSLRQLFVMGEVNRDISCDTPKYGPTFLRYVKNKSTDELDYSISIGYALLDGQDAVQHVEKTVVECFLASQSDTTRWNFFPDIGSGCMNLRESYNILSMTGH